MKFTETKKLKLVKTISNGLEKLNWPNAKRRFKLKMTEIPQCKIDNPTLKRSIKRKNVGP